MKKKEIRLVDIEPMDVLYQDARQIIETARSNAVRSVDFCRVQMYWNYGNPVESAKHLQVTEVRMRVPLAFSTYSLHTFPRTSPSTSPATISARAWLAGTPR